MINVQELSQEEFDKLFIEMQNRKNSENSSRYRNEIEAAAKGMEAARKLMPEQIGDYAVENYSDYFEVSYDTCEIQLTPSGANKAWVELLVYDGEMDERQSMTIEYGDIEQAVKQFVKLCQTIIEVF